MGKQKSSERSVRKRKEPVREDRIICVNTDCRLRIKGCRGFEGCPGYKGKG